MKKYYNISNLILRFDHLEKHRSDGRWEAFCCPEQSADIRCDVIYVPSIPIPAEAVRRGHILSYANTRIYLAVDSDEPYARVTETPGQLLIDIPHSRYPWGRCAEELFELLALPHLLLPYRRLLLHGAYIQYQGEGILFTGPSGIGKTTQARLWQSVFGARSVNEDRAIVSVSADNVWIHGVPVAGSSPVCENISLPLKAIVALSQNAENQITQLRPAQAAARLLDGTYQLPAFRGDIPGACDLALDIAACVPIFHLSCRPDREAAELLYKNIF